MHLSNGTLLQGGKYKIEKKLGQGGFGITYLASQVLLGRKVCIKEFFYKEYCERDATTSNVTLGTKSSRELVDKFMKKFIKEASTISRLDHRNIIRIHDIFTENNTAYYVMEYHSGGSLGDLVKSRGMLPESDAVRYITQIAEAVGYIHERNINHLDIKPANILLNNEGASVLIDFGLSKQYDAQGDQTSSTPVGISHGYAPMEQYNPGGVSTFSPQSDIYSLGATLYKLVTGNTPPKASEILNDGLPALPAHLSAGVRKAIEQAMQPRKKDRPATVKEFLALLSSVVASEKNRDPEITVVIEPEENKSEELTPFKKNGKWGYADKNNKVVISAKYDEAYEFCEALAAVCLNEKWGFIDNNGRVVIPFVYEEVDESGGFSEGLAAVCLDDKWGYIDKRGNEAIPFEYDWVRLFSEGLAAVCLDDKWGFVDKSGNVVIPFKYDNAYFFSNDRAEVELDGKRCYVDRNGKEYKTNRRRNNNTKVINNDPDSTIVIGTKKTVKKEEPKKVAKFPVPSDAEFFDGLAAVESNGKWGYIDKNGNIIVPFKYESASLFLEKLAAVKLRGKWGFIDKQDNLVIPLKYEDAWSFFEGLAAVELKGKYGFINKDGNVVIPLKYDDAEPFSEGLAAVEVNGKWGVIDKSDNVVIPFKYDYVGDFSDGRAEFELNGRKGYLDKYGKEYYNDGGYIPSTPSAKVENKQTVATDDIEEEWSIRKSSFCKWGAFILIIIIFILSSIAAVNGELDPLTTTASFVVLTFAWNIFFD